MCALWGYVPFGKRGTHMLIMKSEAFSTTCALYMEDCGSLWLPSNRSSVADHWWFKPSVLVLIHKYLLAFRFLIFTTYCPTCVYMHEGCLEIVEEFATKARLEVNFATWQTNRVQDVVALFSGHAVFLLLVRKS